MPIAVVLEPPLTLFFLQLFHTFYHRCWCPRFLFGSFSGLQLIRDTRIMNIFLTRQAGDSLEVLRSNGLWTSLFVFGFIVDWVRALHTQAWAQHRGLYVSWSWVLTLWQETTIMTPMSNAATPVSVVTKQVAARNNIQDDFVELELKFKCKLLH